MHVMSISLDRATYDAVSDEAKRTGLTRNMLIRNLCRKELGPKIGENQKVMNFKIPTDAELRKIIGVPDNVI